MDHLRAGGIFSSERVQAFARDMGVAFKQCVTDLTQRLQGAAAINPTIAALTLEQLRATASASIADWGQDLQADEAAKVKATFPGVEDDYIFAFSAFGRNFYGTSREGVRQALDFRVPPFSYFLAKFYGVATSVPDLADPGALSSVVYDDIIKIVLRDTLKSVTAGRVFLKQAPPSSSVATTSHASSRLGADSVFSSRRSRADTDSTDSDSDDDSSDGGGDRGSGAVAAPSHTEPQPRRVVLSGGASSRSGTGGLGNRDTTSNSTVAAMLRSMDMETPI